MGAWATTDKAEMEAHQARIREVFEHAFRLLGLTPRSIAATYSPVGEGERTVKLIVEGLGDTDGR